MDVTCSPKVTAVRPSQLLKQLSGMAVTNFGMAISVKASQFWKA